MRKITKELHKMCVAAGLYMGIAVCISGCDKENKQKGENEQKKIAILGKEDYVHVDEGFLHGVELALQENQGEKLTLEYYDDLGEYENGLSMAKQIAEDPSVVAVYSFQDFEVVDAEAEYFEEAQKPIFAVQGCYEKTLEKGYDYVFTSYMSSRDMGVAMAKYCAEQGYDRVICSHTNTTFEGEEIKGFCSQASKEGVTVVDMTVGPDNENDLNVAYQRWEKLGVNALFISKYVENVEQKEWIFEMIKYIKQKNPNFLIMGDYSLNGAKYLEIYGEYMSGATYPNPYSVTEGSVAEEFGDKYKTHYAEDTLSDGSYQGYDMTKMICTAIEEGNTVKDFFKSEEGYKGVSGEIHYTADGKIQTAYEYYSVVDGSFVEK